MKVFVTGVGGQLGHDVMNELAKRGYEGVGSDLAPVYSGIQDGSPVTGMPYVSMDITNREQVQQYWIERLQQVKGSEEFFTIGMRGIHDGSMEGVRTKQEKLNGLQQVIDDQRELIRKYYDRNVEKVPQVFIPYKEVLEILESGLRVPDDVTLMWCDDNYG